MCSQETKEGRLYKGWGYICHSQSGPLHGNEGFWLGYLGLVEFNIQKKYAGWQNRLAPFKVKNVDDLVVMMRKRYDTGVAEKFKSSWRNMMSRMCAR